MIEIYGNPTEEDKQYLQKVLDEAIVRVGDGDFHVPEELWSLPHRPLTDLED